jgi:hypothetical protein
MEHKHGLAGFMVGLEGGMVGVVWFRGFDDILAGYAGYDNGLGLEEDFAVFLNCTVQ